MTIGSQEHYDLIVMLEREMKGCGCLDKEDKTEWSKGHIYQSGEVNNLFLAYRRGFAYGRAYGRAISTQATQCS